ncbi:hypothetical protein AVEN_96483-1 [Araneus ventricosus]|uniref:Uncharacterized protein n=1 Tax=Araneus ventricosus TaxID=182803 RepID=A0A4Y2CU13_ARAVE|nr:hypothetical protein AVEN_96483-1 [Araneus ventricosus]
MPSTTLYSCSYNRQSTLESVLWNRLREWMACLLSMLDLVQIGGPLQKDDIFFQSFRLGWLCSENGVVSTIKSKSVPIAQTNMSQNDIPINLAFQASELGMEICLRTQNKATPKQKSSANIKRDTHD